MAIALAICAYAYLYRVLHSLTEHKKTGQSGKSSSAASSELSILPIVSIKKFRSAWTNKKKHTHNNKNDARTTKYSMSKKANRWNFSYF